jgi:hypothetical protein
MENNALSSLHRLLRNRLLGGGGRVTPPPLPPPHTHTCSIAGSETVIARRQCIVPHCKYHTCYKIDKEGVVIAGGTGMEGG